jgi:hypothetical protein
MVATDIDGGLSTAVDRFQRENCPLKSTNFMAGVRAVADCPLAMAVLSAEWHQECALRTAGFDPAVIVANFIQRKDSNAQSCPGP